eukprot:TRINITY_DN17463_c0_g1_i3.p1 TRINITY_DN17463_c0_g1~~TRINITY_DN17463_c0_g1_i3.p1  ORF type:complete len:505 (+),score=79.77 TRINITY_DN17463_c0_g1_i3:127-1641(+)
MTKSEGMFGSGGGKSLSLFECSVPEQDCNIHLGSRRKSRGLVLTDRSEKDVVERSALPVGLTAAALTIMQTGRPDMLLRPSIYRKVGEACREGTSKLMSSGKTTFTRKDVLEECRRALDESHIELPLVSHSGRRVESYAASSPGTCDSQEDRCIRVGSVAALCSSDEVDDSQIDHLIGVFDGHGGWEASEYVHERIFYEFGTRGLDCDVEVALREAFDVVDKGFNDIADRDELKAGCTALACLVRGDKLWIANAGDCRAVLASGDTCVALTTDHNVKNPDEVQAVIERGGTMLRNRVNGVLCVTRALGNRMCRELISQTPDIVSRDIDWVNDKFLVIGSDGLYDHFSNEEIVAFVRERHNEIQETLQRLRSQSTGDEMDVDTAEAYLGCTLQKCADDLIKRATSKPQGYCDNTTCVILFFDTSSALSVTELAEASRVVNKHLASGTNPVSPLLTSLSVPYGHSIPAGGALDEPPPENDLLLCDSGEDLGGGDQMESSMCMARPF